MQTRLTTIMIALTTVVTSLNAETVLAQEVKAVKDVINSIEVKMLLTPNGTYQMSATPTEECFDDDERLYEVSCRKIKGWIECRPQTLRHSSS